MSRVVRFPGLEILADDSTDPVEVAHREWLKRRMEAEIRKVASIPTKLR
jgi:hypothetical protein